MDAMLGARVSIRKRGRALRPLFWTVWSTRFQCSYLIGLTFLLSSFLSLLLLVSLLNEHFTNSFQTPIMVFLGASVCRILIQSNGTGAPLSPA